ncbi:DUF6204 family protein [Streptomyces sp. NPDC057675]|uniref:DUF6204 family protein n=1 Tax=Streptomyces sp. NPDC057675 TaxID=3346204 RepID=UPI0036C7E81E
MAVRGSFDRLTRPQRDRLLERAGQHDPLYASFTEEGHLSYDIAARAAFTFRFLATGKEEEDIVGVVTRAEEAATEWLSRNGYAFKNLRIQSEDLSLAPLGKRRRRHEMSNDAVR